MPTSKIINIMVEEERNLSNSAHTLKALANSGILPQVSILSLEHAQDELQNEINRWLPEWYPGTSFQTYAFKHPEHIKSIKQTEEFLLAAMKDMANIADWCDIKVKRFPTKTDCFLVDESWESRVSIDEDDNENEDGLHGMFTMSDVYVAFRNVNRGVLDDLVTMIPDKHKQQAMEDVADCLSPMAMAIDPEQEGCWDQYCSCVEANLLAQMCMFGGLKYML